MAKRGRPTADEREGRRDRILDGAVQAFAAHGFGSAGLDEIAAAAGVTKRTIYVDIGDKAALFAAAVEREHDRLRASAADAGSLIDVATEIVVVLHSDRAVALHRAVIAEAPRFPELAARFYAAGPGHSIRLLQGAMRAEGGGIGDARDRAAALYSLLLGEAHRRRLLALDPAPSRRAAAAHAEGALRLLASAAG
ncbi:TetR/AcrR family transcriptional regulator C-terminal domain-containing protein [Clavibacter sp. VKM Ac-2873]|uniref:TetR/AcrR family transcriptional regulator n=1 Tax=Clavibacter sp. VKM Ac-2873 TaxID=2783813 RepID=UPI00188B0B57|nr:TetR/AcrR family transcriptional regulator C-terminal domain-containing protein [Clavibacter sp. VKM Ac-2873]MBF4618685.1 TetR/AcrR family transcriptional regulator C-terminal domain-containing protein [Clavibacter sp. VKM Ac-2873]